MEERQETWFQSLGWEDLLEEGMAITKEEGHSSAPIAAARNSCVSGAAGGTSLAAGAQHTALAAGSPASVCLSSLGHR